MRVGGRSAFAGLVGLIAAIWTGTLIAAPVDLESEAIQGIDGTFALAEAPPMTLGAFGGLRVESAIEGQARFRSATGTPEGGSEPEAPSTLLNGTRFDEGALVSSTPLDADIYPYDLNSPYPSVDDNYVFGINIEIADQAVFSGALARGEYDLKKEKESLAGEIIMLAILVVLIGLSSLSSKRLRRSNKRSRAGLLLRLKS